MKTGDLDSIDILPHAYFMLDDLNRKLNCIETYATISNEVRVYYSVIDSIGKPYLGYFRVEDGVNNFLISNTNKPII